MDEATKFLIFCIEEYKTAKGLSGSQTVKLFKQHGVTEFILKHHDVLHCDSLDGIIWQLDDYIANHSAKPKEN
jgi:hypothetical protein